MRTSNRVSIFAVALALSSAIVVSAGTPALTFQVARTIQLPAGGAEIVAAAPNGKLAAVTQVGGRVQTVKLPNGKVKKAVDVRDFGEPTSVAFADDKTLLIVVKDDPNHGTLVVAGAKKGKIQTTLPIGIGPDSISVDRTRKLAVISIEDEETEVADPYNCPPGNSRPGSIQIVDYSAGFDSSELVLTTLSVDLSGLDNPGCPDDPQPEFVAIDEARGRAYVTVQENNAIAVVDLETKSIEHIISAGTTSHDAYIDPNKPIGTFEPMMGRREPDGIALMPDGLHFLTADEGDTGVTADGVFSGGRTVSVWSTDSPGVLADTGDTIERAVIDAGFLDTSRSDRHGPEPEGICIFTFGSATIAAVGLERAHSVVFFDVTDPTHPEYLGIVAVGSRPEGIVFVPQHNILLTGNELSGDVTMIEIGPA